jgi:hypothetical protein
VVILKKTKAIVVDYEGCLTKPFGKKGIEKCCEKFGISPKKIIPIIKDPFLEDYLSPEMVADCHQIFREEIENAKPNSSVLELMGYCQNKNYEIFVSSKGFADSIERALKKPEFSSLNVVLVFGREDGNKQEHLEKIRRIYDPDEIIVFGDDPSDFENNAEFKIALNLSGKNQERFLPGTVDLIINSPLTISLAKDFIH